MNEVGIHIRTSLTRNPNAFPSPHPEIIMPTTWRWPYMTKSPKRALR